MKTMNNETIMKHEEVGGAIACIMGCGGLCLLTGSLGSAFGTATELL